MRGKTVDRVSRRAWSGVFLSRRRVSHIEGGVPSCWMKDEGGHGFQRDVHILRHGWCEAGVSKMVWKGDTGSPQRLLWGWEWIRVPIRSWLNAFTAALLLVCAKSYASALNTRKGELKIHWLHVQVSAVSVWYLVMSSNGHVPPPTAFFFCRGCWFSSFDGCSLAMVELEVTMLTVSHDPVLMGALTGRVYP